MLVIAVKEGGIVKIGEDIAIYVQQIGGGQVRVCLSVPKEIKIQHLKPEVPELTEPVVTRRPTLRVAR